MSFNINVYAFLKELKNYQYELSFSDRIWSIIFLDNRNKWNKLIIQEYNETYYISCINKDLTVLAVNIVKKAVVIEPYHSFDSRTSRSDSNLEEQWQPLISSVRVWLKRVQADWIKMSALVIKKYPLNYRKGFVSHSIVRTSLPSIFRLDHDLGKRNTKKFLKIFESGYFRDERKLERTTMTAKIYFDYCQIAYIAAQRADEYVDEKLSGLEMYTRYADGRHEGLLDIDVNSEEEFATWLDGKHPKRERGGHPWEIKRGGNTTHIDLYVTRPKYGEKDTFIVKINAHAISRMTEAIRMFLSLYDKGMPITICDPEDIVKRLLAQDNIGIVPCYDSLHRANQNYSEDQNVHDVVYYDEFGRYRRRINPFITWDPLPILIPKT